MPDNPASGIACLLDTDIVIDFLRHREYAWQLLVKWAGQGLLAISTLTHLEVYQGVKKGESEVTASFLDGLTSIPVDVSIARQAGSFLRQLRTKGVTVSIVDSVIAATALHLEVPLLTNNVDHYPFRGIEVVRGLSTPL